MGGDQATMQYNARNNIVRSGRAEVVSPWATEADLDGGFDGAAPVQAHTCHSYGDQTFIQGSRETADIGGLLSELLTQVSLEQLAGAFRRIDNDGKGSVTSAQYRRIFDNLAPHLPKAISSQIMLLGADEVGIIWYVPLFRALGLDLSTGSPPPMRGQPITRALPSRAKGTSGDIIAHRDDNMFESLDPVRRTNHCRRCHHVGRHHWSHKSNEVCGPCMGRQGSDRSKCTWECTGLLAPVNQFRARGPSQIQCV